MAPTTSAAKAYLPVAHLMSVVPSALLSCDDAARELRSAGGATLAVVALATGAPATTIDTDRAAATALLTATPESCIGAPYGRATTASTDDSRQHAHNGRHTAFSREIVDNPRFRIHTLAERRRSDMAEMRQGRWTAEIDGDFVVFLIGAKPSKLRLLRSLRDLGEPRGMRHMLDHLMKQPEKGLLGYEMAGLGTIIVQYWRSFEALEAFAKNTDDPHLDAWRNYWRRVGTSTRTGIWHETYLVRAGDYEAIYGNMRPFGLGKASRLVKVGESAGARERLRATR